MAKGKRVLPAAATIEFLYHSVAQMPWENIEGSAKKSFSAEERGEIYHCAQGFDWEFHARSKAPPLSEVDNLRDSLLEHCHAIVRLAQFHQPLGRDEDRRSDSDVVSALQIYFDFDLRETFDAVAREAARMAEGLEVRPNFQEDTTARLPETAGLTGYLERVLDGAEPVRARSTPPGRFVADGFEFRRWGIAIGPRAAGFADFTSAVLSRHVTKGMLRKAWPPSEF